MQGSFYSWMRGAADSVAMDAEVMRKHPDGSPCYAKKEEDCPILNKAKKIDKVDNLNQSKSDVEGRHLNEIFNILNSVRDKVPALKDVTYSQLEEAYVDVRDEYARLDDMDDNYIKDTRKIRDKIAQDNPDADYHSFAVDGHDREKELEGLDAWGVTFHTSKMDDMSHDTYLSDDEYDKMVEKLRRVSRAKEFQVGIFQGAPEISVTCEDTKKAIAQLVMFEQCGIYNYKLGKTIYNLTYDENKNPGLKRGTGHID